MIRGQKREIDVKYLTSQGQNCVSVNIHAYRNPVRKLTLRYSEDTLTKREFVAIRIYHNSKIPSLHLFAPASYFVPKRG